MDVRSLFHRGAKIVEVLGLRATPGLINLAALLVIGNRLATDAFGQYSTAAATAMFASSFILGPVVLTIASQHASHAVGNKHRDFETALCAVVIGCSIIA